jgi:hypothetical protein
MNAFKVKKIWDWGGGAHEVGVCESSLRRRANNSFREAEEEMEPGLFVLFELPFRTRRYGGTGSSVHISFLKGICT